MRSIVFLIQHDILKAIYFIWIPTKEMVIFAIARRTGCLEYIEEWFIFHSPVQNLKGFSWVILIILRFFHYVTYPLYNIWLYCNRMLCLLLEGILVSSHFSIFSIFFYILTHVKIHVYPVHCQQNFGHFHLILSQFSIFPATEGNWTPGGFNLLKSRFLKPILYV